LSTVRFNTLFEFSHHERTRGHSLKLHENRVLTDLRQHSFSERVIIKWNSLSEDTVSAPSLNSNKGKLQRLYNDGSSTGFFKSPGRASSPGRPNLVSYPASLKILTITSGVHCTEVLKPATQCQAATAKRGVIIIVHKSTNPI